MPNYNEICHYKYYEKNNNSKKSKYINFTAKFQYLNLKAPSNNVKLQSD